LSRKRKRVATDKPEDSKRPIEEKAVASKANAEMKAEESDESYQFEPACENCSG